MVLTGMSFDPDCQTTFDVPFERIICPAILSYKGIHRCPLSVPINCYWLPVFYPGSGAPILSTMQGQDVERGVLPSDYSAPGLQLQGEKPETRSSSIEDEDTKEIFGVVKEQSVSDLDQYQVAFEKDDLENPLNWSFKKKFIVTGVAILLIFNS